MGRFIKEETRRYVRLLSRVSSMGIAMALSIVIGLAAGYYVDKWLGTEPWGFFVGLAMGIVAAFRNLYIIVQRSRNK